MTKHKKRKAHTRALAKERGISYRTALHQESGGGELPPDFRLELELESFRDEPPYGLRLRVPGIEAINWLGHPRDSERVMEQVEARVPKEFPHVLEDFRLWLQLDELPEQDMSLDEHEWTHISFRAAHRAIQQVLLGAVEYVGWGSWGDETPYDLLYVPSLKGMFELVAEGLMRDATDAQMAAFAPFFMQAREAAMRLDAQACAAALKAADSSLSTLGWERPMDWEEDEDVWNFDGDFYTGPESFSMYQRGGVSAFVEEEASGGLVLRNGDEYVVRAKGRMKLNDGRRCVLLAHEALRGGSAVRVRFLDTKKVSNMDAADLVWAARGPEVSVPPRKPRQALPPINSSRLEASVAAAQEEPMASDICGVVGCGKTQAGESLFCADHEGVYFASEYARWPKSAGFEDLLWEVVRQLCFAAWASTVGRPGRTVPPETDESRVQRAGLFEMVTSMIREGKGHLTQK